MGSERAVRVRCPRHQLVHIGWAQCRMCNGTGDEPGTILATLSDPEVEALSADGERYRELAAHPDLLDYVLDVIDARAIVWGSAPPEAGQGVGG